MIVCTLASSSSGNCTIVSHGKTHLLIDAGISLKRMREGLKLLGLSPDDLTGVLVTHDHSDHIGGIEMLVKYHKTPIFASFGAGCGIFSVMPAADPFVNCFETGVTFELGDITVCSFRTPHDAAESVGYRLAAGGRTVSYVTDLGSVTGEVLEAAIGADLAVIEANHDREMLKTGPYPPFLKKRILSAHGHLSNGDSGEFAARLALSGTRFLQLAHLSRENNTPGLARRTVAASLEASGIAVASGDENDGGRSVRSDYGSGVRLDVAPPFTPGRAYVL